MVNVHAGPVPTTLCMQLVLSVKEDVFCFLTSCLVCENCLGADAGKVHQHGPARNLGIITKMLAESGLPAEVKEKSIAVFTALGEAEAKTHGSTLDQVGSVTVRSFRRLS